MRRGWIASTVIIALMLGAGGLLSGVLFIPLLGYLERAVEKNTPCTLTVGRARLSLAGDIVLTQLTLEKGKGAPLAVSKVVLNPRWTAFLRRNIIFESITMVLDDGVLKGNGTLAFRPPSVSLEGTTDRFPLDRLAGVFTAIPESLRVAHTGTWRLAGDLRRWELNVDGTLDRGLSATKSTPRVSCAARFDGRQGKIDLVLSHQKSVASGTVNLDTQKQRLEGDFKLIASPLSSFDALSAELRHVRGTLTVAGRLAGPWASPEGTIRATGEGLAYKGFGIRLLQARFERKAEGAPPLAFTVTGSSLTWPAGMGKAGGLSRAQVAWRGTPTHGDLQWKLNWDGGASMDGRGPGKRNNKQFNWSWDRLRLILPRGKEFAAVPGGSVDINSPGAIEVKNLQVGEGGQSLIVRRFLFGSGNIALEVSSDDYWLELPGPFLQGGTPFAGRLNGDLSLRGPLDGPQGQFDLQITSGSYRASPPLSGRVKGIVENDRVVISEAVFGSEPFPSIQVHGSLPWAWMLSKESDQPMDMSLDTGRLDPAILLKGNPEMKIAPGGGFRIQGRLRGPKGAISGEGNLTAFLPLFEMASFGIAARDTGVDIELKDRHLLIRKAETKLGKGILRVSGESDLPSLALDVEGKKISLRRRRRLEILTDLHCRVRGTLSAPLLTGTLALTEGTYEAGKKKDAGENAPDENEFLSRAWESLQMNVEATWANNVWYRDGLSKIETKGDLEVIKWRGDRAPGVRGQVTVLKGNYDAYGRDFILKTGELTFTDPSELDPTLNLQATHKMRDTLIELDVSGTASKPELHFQSTPPLPEQDILALLALGKIPGQSASQGSAPDDNSSEAKDLAADVVSNYLTRELRSAGMNVLDLDVIRVAPSEKGNEWTVGRYWGSKLFLSYSYNPEDAANQVLKGEYSLSPRWTVVGQTGSQTDNYLDLTFRLPVGKSRKKKEE